MTNTGEERATITSTQRCRQLENLETRIELTLWLCCDRLNRGFDEKKIFAGAARGREKENVKTRKLFCDRMWRDILKQHEIILRDTRYHLAENSGFISQRWIFLSRALYLMEENTNAITHTCRALHQTDTFSKAEHEHKQAFGWFFTSFVGKRKFQTFFLSFCRYL